MQGVGRRRHGKKQLRVDEARRWRVKAHELATAGDCGAVAALLTLMMGLRASEIIGLVARDLDDGGRLLWVGEAEAKTEASKRRMRVPAELRDYLLAFKRDKLPLAPLFGHHWRDWPRKQVERICRLAKVEKVTAHGMRGLHATLATPEAADSGDMAARALGHSSATITRQSYASAESVAAGRQSRVVGELEG